MSDIGPFRLAYLEAPRFEQRDPSMLRCIAQLAVEHRKMKRDMIAENLERRFLGGKMDAAVAPQANAPGQIGGAANQRLGRVRYLPRSPLDVEIPAQGGEQRVVPSGVSHPRERGAGLDVGDRMRGDQARPGDRVPDLVRVGFHHEQLHQGGGIQLTDHPRCSLTISASVFSPFPIRSSGFGNAGLSPFPGRTPGSRRKRSISSASEDTLPRRARGGSERATSLPAVTRRRISDRRLFNLRTEIFMASSRGDYIGNWGHEQSPLARQSEDGPRPRVHVLARRLRDLKVAPEDSEIEAIEPIERTARVLRAPELSSIQSDGNER